MARGQAYVQRTSFVGGLHTESNPLNQPDNTLQQVSNFEIKRNGDMRRRLGIEREDGYVETSTSSISNQIAIVEYLWDNPGLDLAKQVTVVQAGPKLLLFDSSTTTPSANVTTIDLNDESTISIAGQAAITFAAISGYLVFASEELDTPYYLYYDKDADTYIVGKIYIKVRDVWGVDDGLGVDERPETLTDKHLYNLFNQGWGEKTSSYEVQVEVGRIPKYETISSLEASREKIDDVFSDRGTYPSNAEIESLYSSGADNVKTNTSPAPKGRFVINAFTRGESRKDSLEFDGTPLSLDDDADRGKVTLVKAFSDRVFYSGVASDITNGDLRSPDFSSTVFFSESFLATTSFGKCHQEADPTSEDFSEIVATDGGFITISEANEIVALEQFGNYLLVFASNGVWGISGTDGGFAANDYLVTKLTSTGALNNTSVVVSRDSVLYWSNEGIFSITPSEIKDALSVNPLIDKTIQTFYNDISSPAKLYAKGVFDRVEQRVRWLYNDSDSYDGVTDRYAYNKELILDVTLGAWYSYDFGSAWIKGYVVTSPYTATLNVQNVVHNGEDVVYNGEQVTYTTAVRSTSLSQTKYLLRGWDSVNAESLVYLTVGQLSNSDFLDWVGNTFIDVNGVDAAASALMSWTSGGDTTRRKDVEYLHLFSRRTETGVDVNGNAFNESSCLFRVRWDFADSTSSGKFSPQRQGYRYKRMYVVDDTGALDYGQEVITTKNRVRGSGKVLAVEVNTEPGKDLHLHGYAITLLGNQEE